MRTNPQAKAEIEALRKVFPKCDKRVYSVCSRTWETGAEWSARAKGIIREAQGKPRKPENRKYKNRIYGRIPDELAVRVQTKLAEQNRTMQDLLLELLTGWIEEGEK